MQADPDDLVVLIAGHHEALLEPAVEQGLAQRDCDARLRDDARTSASTSSSSASGVATRLSAGLGIDVGDLELAARRRRRRAPADHTQARHGKVVFRPDRPRVFKTRNLCPNSATTPAN